MQDSSLLVLVGGRIAVIRFDELARVSWGEFEATDAGAALRRSPRLLRRGRAASRFPYGVPAPAMASLLARFGQTAPDASRGTTSLSKARAAAACSSAGRERRTVPIIFNLLAITNP